MAGSIMGELFRVVAGRELLPGELKNSVAYLGLIRYLEGTDGPEGYRTWIGHKLFSSYDKHPGKRMDIRLYDKEGGYWYNPSAAGAYQFILSTYKSLKSKGFFPDFTPPSQDQAAIQLLKDSGALRYIMNGDLNNAYKLTYKTWASIPGHPTQSAEKRGITRDMMKKYFESKGGIAISK